VDKDVGMYDYELRCYIDRQYTLCNNLVPLSQYFKDLGGLLNCKLRFHKNTNWALHVLSMLQKCCISFDILWTSSFTGTDALLASRSSLELPKPEYAVHRQQVH
jgi:hypothetical protein